MAGVGSKAGDPVRGSPSASNHRVERALRPKTPRGARTHAVSASLLRFPLVPSPAVETLQKRWNAGLTK